MENLFEQLLEKAKTNRKIILKLKDVCVAAQQYELAAKIREIEKKFFLRVGKNKKRIADNDRVFMLILLALHTARSLAECFLPIKFALNTLLTAGTVQLAQCSIGERKQFYYYFFREGIKQFKN
jgi:hypothetical protein